MKVRYRVRVNRAGLIFIGITIFLGVAAVNTANNLLYLIVSSLLSFMLVSGVISLYNLRGLTVLLIPPEEVYARNETPFRVVVKNHKSFPSFLVVVKKEERACVFPIVPAKDEVEDFLIISFERRGFCPTVKVEVSSPFPVGMFERFFDLEVEVNLVVFPQLLPIAGQLFGEGLDERGSSIQYERRRGYEELHGVREYAGEPPKLIHWKLSAKTGSLYVKDMVEESAPPLILSLDMVEGTLEERISKLSYLVVKYISEGRAVGLKLGTNTIEPSLGNQHKKRLLTELALL